MKKYRLVTLDFETDPFQEWKDIQEQRIPMPFACGLNDPEGAGFIAWRGDDCIKWAMEYLRKELPPSLVYAHNGGKFDFHFLRPYFEGDTTIIGGRIAKAQLYGHDFRDSYSILPVALKKLGGKLDIAYWKMKQKHREKHWPEIRKYLEADCKVLHDAISTFCERFSPNGKPPLTMAAAAMREFRKFHKVERMKPANDGYIRKNWFYGGRCQCFEGGLLKGNFKVFDVNSMYPFVMKTFQHPISATYTEGTEITDKTFFLTVEAENKGAFLYKDEKTLETTFDKPNGVFHISIHEYYAAIETGTAKIKRIISTIDFEKSSNFAAFIDEFWGRRLKAKEEGNELDDLYNKLIMNSSFGKQALNPRKFMEYMTVCNKPITGDGWQVKFINTVDKYCVFERPLSDTRKANSYNNVATAASITGAARAVFLRGLAKAKRPIYGDTDSIICEALDIIPDTKTLGGWKLEAEGELMAIGGKKLYCLMTRNSQAIKEKLEKVLKDPNGDKSRHFVTVKGKEYLAIKTANKGTRITPEQILEVALGGEVIFRNPVPTFRAFAPTVFQKRKIRATYKRHA